MPKEKCKVLYIKDMKNFYYGENFKIGEIYKCEYTDCSNVGGNIYMEVYGEHKSVLVKGNYEIKELEQYFIKIIDNFNLTYYKERKGLIIILRKLIAKIKKKSFKTEYKKVEYFYTIEMNLFKKAYLILEKIKNIQSSDFYRFHQDKVKYIVDSLTKLYPISNEKEFNKYYNDCLELMTKIEQAIKIAEDKVEIQDEKNKEEMMKIYSEKQKSLFKQWNAELSDLWEVEK